MTTGPTFLTVEPLDAQTFSAFGEVIEVSPHATHYTINDGFAERYHDLARLDVMADGGRPIVSIFRARARLFPLHLQRMERHPLGSQAFICLQAQPYLVVVAPAAGTLDTRQIRCFRAEGRQGVNYRRGTWHHPLIALHEGSDFLVLDRGAAAVERNLDEVAIGDAGLWVRPQ